MRFTEARHRQVVATSTATKLGRVEGFVVDPGQSRVTALRLGGKGATLVSWSALRGFGTDAVTVDDDSALRQPHDHEEERRAGKDLDLLGKVALLETGQGVGTVTDVDFDAADGSIRSVLTTHAEIPGSALVGVGGYAAVFAAPD